MAESLDGRWRVTRERGFLPPFGIRKSIHGKTGWTRVGPLPVAPFRVRGTRLVYRLWPVEDDLDLLDDGSYLGRGYLFGRKFCEFRMRRS